MTPAKRASKIWKWLIAVDMRHVIFAGFAAAAFIALSQIALLGANAMVTGGIWIAAMIFIFAICFLMAGVLAVPGWLFRGSYDVRPLFVSALVVTLVTAFLSETLTPLAIGTSFGIVWKFLGFVLVIGANFLGTFALLMTTFTHRWRHGLFLTAAILSLLGGIGVIKESMFENPNDYHQEVFEKKESNLVPILGGRAVSSAQISYELRLFESEALGGARARAENPPGSALPAANAQ